MITTTAVWPQQGTERNPNLEEFTALSAFAESLCGDTLCGLTTVESGTDIISTRTWPTLEAAQAWVEYLLANHRVTSAVIDNDE